MTWHINHVLIFILILSKWVWIVRNINIIVTFALVFHCFIYCHCSDEKRISVVYLIYHWIFYFSTIIKAGSNVEKSSAWLIWLSCNFIVLLFNLCLKLATIQVRVSCFMLLSHLCLELNPLTVTWINLPNIWLFINTQ